MKDQSVQGKWIGDLRGTNIGTLYMELSQKLDRVEGVLHTHEVGVAIIVYDVEGFVKGSTINLKLTPTQVPSGAVAGKCQADAEVKEDGSLVGTWKSEIGTAGVFTAFRPEFAQNNDKKQSLEPEQVYFRHMPIDSVRLYKEDLLRLLAILQKDFSTSTPIVTYNIDGHETMQFGGAFIKNLEGLDKIYEIKISIQEPDRGSVYKGIDLHLFRYGNSVLHVTGASDSWVSGRATIIKRHIERLENKIISWYRKHGLSINSVMLLLIIAIAPEFEFRSRMLLVFSIGAFLALLLTMHRKFIPNTLIVLGEVKAPAFSRYVQKFASLVIIILSGVASSALFLLLQSDHVKAIWKTIKSMLFF